MNRLLRNKEVIALALFLTAFDAVATYLMISIGYGVEANPIIDSLISNYGLLPAMLMRTVAGGFFVMLLAVINHEKADLALGFITIILLLVACWHVYGYLAWSYYA